MNYQSTAKLPTFTLNAPSTIPVNSIFTLTIDAWLPYGYSTYAAEGVSLATDGSLTIVSVNVLSAGTNYDFLFDYTLLKSTGVTSCASVTPGEKLIRLDVGYVPNKGMFSTARQAQRTW